MSSDSPLRKKGYDFDYKIVIVGPAYAGKTTMLKYLTERTGYADTLPTYGFQMERIKYRDLEFLVFDVGGQPVFVHTLWKKQVETAQAIIFVVDAADPKSIQLSRDYLRYIATWINEVPLLLLANKQDLPNAASKEELLERLEIAELFSELHVSAFQIFETSARTGMGILEAFDWLIQKLQHIIPQKSKFTIYKLIVYNKKSGLPISELKDSIDKPATFLEWDVRSLTQKPKSLSGTGEREDAANYSISSNTVMFSGILSAIDMSSSFLGVGEIKSLTFKGDDNQTFLLFKEELGDLSCIILCNEDDDIYLVRKIAQKILHWINSTHHSDLFSVDAEVFKNQVTKIIKELSEFQTKD